MTLFEPRHSGGQLRPSMEARVSQLGTTRSRIHDRTYPISYMWRARRGAGTPRWFRGKAGGARYRQTGSMLPSAAICGARVFTASCREPRSTGKRAGWRQSTAQDSTERTLGDFLLVDLVTTSPAYICHGAAIWSSTGGLRGLSLAFSCFFLPHACSSGIASVVRDPRRLADTSPMTQGQQQIARCPVQGPAPAEGGAVQSR